MKRIAAALGVTTLLVATTAASAGAVPISRATCVRDYQPVPCVKRTWSPPAQTGRTYRGKPFDPRTR